MIVVLNNRVISLQNPVSHLFTWDSPYTTRKYPSTNKDDTTDDDMDPTQSPRTFSYSDGVLPQTLPLNSFTNFQI